MDKIYKSLDELELNELRFDDCYFEKEKLLIHASQDSISVIDLTNALQQGKTCKVFRINYAEWKHDSSITCDLFNALSDWEFTFTEFIDKLKLTEPVSVSKWEKVVPLLWLEDKFKIYYDEHKAINTYSPFVKVKSIKQPTKWTLPHVWKAILSGQITSGECTGYYTDDYAFDAAVNFRQGEISPIHIAKDLIGSPSGWWVSVDSETDDKIILTVCCHHFNNNKLVFRKNFSTPTPEPIKTIEPELQPEPKQEPLKTGKLIQFPVKQQPTISRVSEVLNRIDLIMVETTLSFIKSTNPEMVKNMSEERAILFAASLVIEAKNELHLQ